MRRSLSDSFAILVSSFKSEKWIYTIYLARCLCVCIVDLISFLVLSFFSCLVVYVQFYWIFGVVAFFVLINYADLDIFSEHHHHHHHQVSVGGKPAHKKFSLKRFFRLKSSASTTKTDELRNGLILKFNFDFAHENSIRNRHWKGTLNRRTELMSSSTKTIRH